MKNIDDFQKAARERNITRWNIHNCSMCGYPCGYEIKGDEVFYDKGCDCVWGGLRTSSWDELAAQFNLNAGDPNWQEKVKKHPLFADVIREDNQFWGFENPDGLPIK